MSNLNKRMVILSSITLLFLLAIGDIVIREEEMFDSFARQFVNEQRTEDFRRDHQSVKATIQQNVDFSRQDDLKDLELTTDGGNVSVKRSSDSKIRLSYTVTATGASQEVAERQRDTVQVTQAKHEGRLEIVTKSNGKAIDPDRIQVDYDLYVPDGLTVIIGNDHGKVNISEVKGDIQVTSAFGLVEINQVQGQLTSSISYGSLVISDIRGQVTFKSSNSYVHASNIEGRVTLNSRSGNLFIDRVTGDVIGETENGDIHFREILGSVSTASKSSALQLEQVHGDMNITAKYGETRLLLPANKGYTLDLSVENGRIHSQLPQQNASVGQNEDSPQLNSVIGDGKWQVHVQANSGEVFLHTTK